jgi:hypothetical protein
MEAIAAAAEEVMEGPMVVGELAGTKAAMGLLQEAAAISHPIWVQGSRRLTLPTRNWSLSKRTFTLSTLM